MVLMLVGTLVGLFVILNQYGTLISRQALRTFDLDIAFLSPLWGINSGFEHRVSYWVVLAVLLVVGASTLALSSSVRGGAQSFVQGLCTGFLALPAMSLAAVVAALVGYLAFLILKAIFYVVGLIAIPFKWMFDHILLPILRWISVPFVWLWEHGLRDVLEFLATPLVWLWHVILEPLLQVLFKYVFKPLLGLVLGSLVFMIGLLPFAVVGLALLEGARSSWKGPLDPRSLFGDGVALGFLLFDSVLLIVLSRLEILQSSPPFTLLLLLIAPVVMALRLLGTRPSTESVEAEVTWMGRVQWYVASSKMDVVAACVVMPALLVASIVASSED